VDLSSRVSHILYLTLPGRGDQTDHSTYTDQPPPCAAVLHTCFHRARETHSANSPCTCLRAARARPRDGHPRAHSQEPSFPHCQRPDESVRGDQRLHCVALSAAQCNAVSPKAFATFTSAWRSISIRTTAEWPLLAANWSAPRPSSFCAETLAERPVRYSTTSWRPFHEAHSRASSRFLLLHQRRDQSELATTHSSKQQLRAMHHQAVAAHKSGVR
jgi:hypothetical protein